jgi:hypothetical protein
VHAAATGSVVDPKIEFFIETLNYVGQYWEVANNYARILTRVVQRGRHGDLNFTAMRKSVLSSSFLFLLRLDIPFPSLASTCFLRILLCSMEPLKANFSHTQRSLLTEHRSSYDLVSLTSSTRQSGIEQTSIQTATLSELDNIDVFDFFNFPKVAEPASRNPNGQHQAPYQLAGIGSEASGGNGMPDPETDWLRYGGSFS